MQAVWTYPSPRIKSTNRDGAGVCEEAYHLQEEIKKGAPTFFFVITAFCVQAKRSARTVIMYFQTVLLVAWRIAI
jgi:hypothetical protein